MIKDELKNRMREFLKSGMRLECTLLRTVIGEINTVEARLGELTDDKVVKILKRFKQANEETIGLLDDKNKRRDLERENEVLDGFIPAVLSEDDIIAALEPIKEQLAGMAVGPATGRAIGFLKQAGHSVEGGTVSKIVRQLRAQNEDL
jgi:uncharacterized protein YqeY